MRALSAQWRHDDLLDLADFTGRRVVETRLAENVLIAEGNAAAALEVMSRWAAHPRWLIYLPPTMSPVETARDGAFLERPEQAFEYFAGRSVARVVCQEKHMGSRAVLVVCRSADAARARFGAPDGETGAVLTRTGRPFFNDPEATQTLLDETARALDGAGLWDALQTDWVCVDAEFLPWNAKAQGLLREQYAPVGAAGRATLAAEQAAMEAAAARGVEGAEPLAARLGERLADLEAYRDAYARYCWDVTGLDGVRVAPFHVLAVEGQTLLERDHAWHIETLARLAAVSPRFLATGTQTVETGDAASVQAGVAWWEEKTAAGGEGMVVKPWAFLPPPRCQPAVKVRGREYLRIIYGPEYTQPENLSRLRERGLGAKRALASREFALGVEGLERFVRREPLRRVHECTFGVLAMESEPVDPRL